MVEVAAWLLGFLCLAVYGGIRHLQAEARQGSVVAFELAQHEHASPQSIAARAPVDMSAWSSNRIDAYLQSSRGENVPEALLHIPRLKLTIPVFAGTTERNLNRGAGFIEGTSRAGGAGNVGIAAHRDGFFRALKDVQIGDTLLLEEPSTTHSYEVVARSVVNPTDVEVLRQTAIPTVTLVTCYPFYFAGSAPQRFIVRAQLTQRSPDNGRKSVR